MCGLSALVLSSILGRAFAVGSERIGSIPKSVNVDFATPRFCNSSPLKVTIDPTSSFGVWEGFGTSLCWWAGIFGAREDLADLFFTMNFTSIPEVNGGAPLPGLGLTIAR